MQYERGCLDTLITRRPRDGYSLSLVPCFIYVFEYELISLDRHDSDGEIGNVKALIWYYHRECIHEAEIYNSTQRYSSSIGRPAVRVCLYFRFITEQRLKSNLPAE